MPPIPASYADSPQTSFGTVPAAETPAAMAELHERFDRAMRSGDYHPLLLVGCYVFDLLATHPFRDSNGRLGRLLTLLLLYQAGYEVGRFVSLERLIQETSTTYWHDEAASDREHRAPGSRRRRRG